MALIVKDSKVATACTLSVLTASDVFSYNGETYMLLERARDAREEGYPKVFNLSGRYFTYLPASASVMPLDATLTVDGVAANRVDRMNEAEIAECRAGRRIQAIKLARERTGFGLKEAKDLVDNDCARLGIPMR